MQGTTFQQLLSIALYSSLLIELISDFNASKNFVETHFMNKIEFFTTSVQSRKVLQTAASVRSTCREAIIDTLLT